MMNTIRFARRSIARALCVVALAAAAPAAAIPDVVSWAARVENDAGAFDGIMTVTFELFDADTGGAALWTELVPSAVVVDGDLVHELGSVEPLDDSLIDRDNLFLQVTMNGDVLAPRTALRAVPYALRSTDAGHADEASHAVEATHAADATTLAGLSAASFQFTAGAGGGLKLTGTAFAINTSGVVTTMIADGAVTSAKIAAEAVTATQLATGAVTTADIADASVTSIKIASDAVTSSKIDDGAVRSNHLGTNAVETAAIAAESVTGAKIKGAEISVRLLPIVDGNAICGNGLTSSTSCITIGCDNVNNDQAYWTCTGACDVNLGRGATCAVTGTPVGLILNTTVN